jgi:hypothetical protein
MLKCLAAIITGTVFVMLVVSATSYGHPGGVHEIFFPKVFSPADLQTAGIVLLNPGPTAANVMFYFLSSAGAPLTSSTAIVGPGGQFARLGSELFPAATSDGWVYVITDVDGMQAFWLTYDSSMTFLDGAAAAQIDTIGTVQTIPFVTANTELNVISLQSAITTSITIHVYGADGELTSPAVRRLPPAGALRASLADIFSNADLSGALYVQVVSPDAAIVSAAVIRGFQRSADVGVVNGVNAFPGTEITFPHVVNGTLPNADYTTTIGVINASDAPQTITITFNPESGPPIVVTRALSPHGALRDTAQSLFGLTRTFRTGWVRVSGAEPVFGFAAYSDTLGGAFAVVPPATPQTNLFFLHIADGTPQWQTGLAVLNTSASAADVEVLAIDPRGSLIGSTTVTIDGGKKIAAVIHELIPNTKGRNGGYVYVRSKSAVPLYGLELFYTEDLKVMSNVAAGTLLKGVDFVPPKR